MDDILQKAKNYLQLDTDPKTLEEMKTFIENKDMTTLTERLHGRISFGTAGLRAPMGAGTTRINCLTVLQTTQGLYSYLEKNNSKELQKGIVVGHDHRHQSYEFAQLTASVFLNKGIPVYFYKQTVHTPMIPFTILQTDAACGIMITASHNPKQDNGYKLYWNNGCQIISPKDKEIAESIE